MRKGSIEFIVGVIIVLALIFDVALNYTNKKDITLHIKKVTSVTGKNVKYLIFTKEGVFENSDQMFLGKFNSSDIQNKLIGEKTCKVETFGQRIPFLSMYPNIVKVYWCKKD